MPSPFGLSTQLSTSDQRAQGHEGQGREPDQEPSYNLAVGGRLHRQRIEPVARVHEVPPGTENGREKNLRLFYN
jgi:hypothetical protein